MELDISQAEIDELVRKAQSAKILPPERQFFDGEEDANRVSATFAYNVLCNLGIKVEVDKDL